VTRLGLRNATLHPGMPHEDVPALLTTADVLPGPAEGRTAVRDLYPVQDVRVPGSRKAVIGSVTGEAARILREAGALVVPPEDSVALADAIRELAVSPQRRQALGRAGWTYVEQCYDRAALAREYRKLLDFAGGRL